MLDVVVSEFFASLKAQVEEDVIVEDDVDLATVALLVPMLCRVVAHVVPHPEAQAALEEVNAAMREVLSVARSEVNVPELPISAGCMAAS
jgi:hypothetical protein